MERGAFAGMAGNGDRTVVAGYDAMHNRKAKARAFALLLGGKERIEDAVQRGAVHAAPVVADKQPNVGSDL